MNRKDLLPNNIISVAQIKIPKNSKIQLRLSCSHACGSSRSL